MNRTQPDVTSVPDRFGRRHLAPRVYTCAATAVHAGSSAWFSGPGIPRIEALKVESVRGPSRPLAPALLRYPAGADRPRVLRLRLGGFPR